MQTTHLQTYENVSTPRSSRKQTNKSTKQ